MDRHPKRPPASAPSETRPSKRRADREVHAFEPAREGALPGSVYDCTHFSEILRRFLAHKQAINPRFTLGLWAKKLGLRTSGTLVHLLKGHRKPALPLADDLARFMGLDADETDYFRILVEMTEAPEGAPTKTALTRRLSGLRQKAATKVLKLSRFETVVDPRHFAVREILQLAAGPARPEWIQRRLRIPTDLPRVRQILENLGHAGLVRKETDGSYRPTVDFYETPSETSSAAVHAYHEDCLQRAARLVHEVPPSERHYTSEIFCLREANLPRAKALIDDFVREFSALLAEKPGAGDQVYQLNLNFIPLTHREENENETAAS